MALLPDTIPGEKLLTRIWETAEKSCIGLARPWLTKREGTAKAAADYRNKMALGQAEADLEEVKAGRARYDAVAGKLVPLVRPLPTLPELQAVPASATLLALDQPKTRTIPRLGSALDFATHTLLQSTVKEMERTINLEKILQQAEAEADGVQDADVSDVAPSTDWIARWREGAQDVTAEQVQLIWARLLTGEVKRPGSFSLRTLDFIRSVSVEEAKLIEGISALAISQGFVYRSDTHLEKRGFYLSTLLALQSIGVISGVGGHLHWRLRPADPPVPGGLLHHDLGITWQRIASEVQLPCYPLTQLGQELLRVGNYKGDREYLRGVAEYLGQHGVRCGLGDAASTGENSARIVEEEWFGPTDVEEVPAGVAPSS